MSWLDFIICTGVPGFLMAFYGLLTVVAVMAMNDPRATKGVMSVLAGAFALTAFYMGWIVFL